MRCTSFHIVCDKEIPLISVHTSLCLQSLQPMTFEHVRPSMYSSTAVDNGYFYCTDCIINKLTFLSISKFILSYIASPHFPVVVWVNSHFVYASNRRSGSLISRSFPDITSPQAWNVADSEQHFELSTILYAYPLLYAVVDTTDAVTMLTSMATPSDSWTTWVVSGWITDCFFPVWCNETIKTP